MDFNLNEDQRAFQDAVRSFATRELKGGALALAHQDDYPYDIARRMAKQGLFGITLPEDKGGQGGTLLDAVIAIEEVALACPRSGDVVQAGNFGAIRVLGEYANPEQKKRFLDPLLRGDGLIATCMTEPGAGSSATDLITSATPDGDGYRVNGTKIFTTHGRHADQFLTYVRFGPGLNGIGSVMIERGTQGLTFGKPTRFLSGESWNQIYFDNVYVPRENLLLGEGGFKRQISAFNVERLGNASRSLALGEYAFRTARDYALTRKQFGRPLCEFQGLQWKFAKMRMDLDSARLMLYRAAVSADTGLPSASETAMAKYCCNQAGFNAANEAMQVMGGAGYSEDCLVEYCFRRCRGWMIAGGSMEILLNRIAEQVFERSFSQRPEKAKA